MLSILIPEYNYNCTKLVSDLAAQCKGANVAYEIIVLDDASTLYISENQKIIELSCCHFVKSEQNLGSAKVRNELAKMATYPHLLMIDCDAEVCNKDFIQRYLDIMGQHQVIIGGVAYQHKAPSINHYLRWFYGKNRECPAAVLRNQNPYKSVLSFNLMIEKDVLLKYPYDENFTDYGHEDSVMGFTFRKAGISILHIDNTLIHNGLDLNEVFLAKSLKAVEKYFTCPVFQSKEMVEEIKIFRAFEKVRDLGLCRIIAFKYRVAKKVIVHNLCGKHPSMLLFDFYRLGYMCNYFLN